MIEKDHYCIAEKSYIKIGGIVKKYLESDDLLEVKQYLKTHQDKDFIYLGNTSKMLFAFDYSDKYYLKFTRSQIVDKKDTLIVDSGVSLPYLVRYMIEKGYGGIEKLGDIPGLIGGSIVNNCGCFFESIGDIVEKVVALNRKGEIVIISHDKALFTYRSSIFKSKQLLIVKVYFKKIIASSDALKASYLNAHRQRLKVQPHGIRTLGSTFTNPQGISIGQILERLGAKNFQNETARISLKHANFIEIYGHNSFRNILVLIERCSKLLYNYLDIAPKLEIIVLES